MLDGMSSGPFQPLPDELARGILSSLTALGRAMTADYAPRTFLAEFSRAVRAFLPHDRMVVIVYGADLRTYSVFAEHIGARASVHDSQYTSAYDPAARHEMKPWATERVRTGDPLRFGDIQAEPLINQGSAPEKRLADMGFRSMLVYPIRQNGAIVAAVSVSSLTPNAYGEEEERRLGALLDAAGPFFSSAIARVRERWRRDRLAQVERLSRQLAKTLDPRASFSSFATLLRPLLDYDHMGIGLLSTDGTRVEILATTQDLRDGLRPEETGRTSSPHDGVHTLEYSFDSRLRAGECVIVREAAAELDPKFQGDALLLASRMSSLMFVPIFLGERFGGALHVGKSRISWYDDADAEFGRAVALYLSLAIQHHRLATEEKRRLEHELRERSLEQRIETLRTELDERWGFGSILGRSKPLRAAIADARKLAGTAATVLITGESGTGKELVARALHVEGPRREGPFVALNCAALPENLLESELFGHVKGAFTGADKPRVGRFERAAGGTLFLDEIGELAPGVQAKLLRVLQEREYSPLGSSSVVKTDVRLIAATNRDLKAELRAGRFRDDLYYRLSVVSMHMPALRDREDDVLILAEHFLRHLGHKMGKPVPTLTREARSAMLSYAWPGNVRELSNTIERALILGEGERLDTAALGLDFRPVERPPTVSPVAPPEPTSLPDLERRAVEQALDHARWNRSKAAKLLGVTRSQLYTRMKRFGLE